MLSQANQNSKDQYFSMKHDKDAKAWRADSCLSLGPFYGEEGGGGGGGSQQSFVRGGSAPRSKPFSFDILFLIGKVTLSYVIHRTLSPFHIPTERHLLTFSLE